MMDRVGVGRTWGHRGDMGPEGHKFAIFLVMK